MNAIYDRVLLKLSGEALMGNLDFGIDPQVISSIAAQVSEVHHAKVQLGIVVGGGNLFRGVSLSAQGMERANADYMGMLATVMNALAFKDALKKHSIPVNVMSAIPMNQVCQTFTRRDALEQLQQGTNLIFAAGTGNPFFTTDTAASLRAIEIDAQIVLKATKVDGVYSADPVLDKEAIRYEKLSYNEVLQKELKVMDATAIALCRENSMPLRVFKLGNPNALIRAVNGENEGTLIERGDAR